MTKKTDEDDGNLDDRFILTQDLSRREQFSANTKNNRKEMYPKYDDRTRILMPQHDGKLEAMGYGSSLDEPLILN